jgi:hypothetical protein
MPLNKISAYPQGFGGAVAIRGVAYASTVGGNVFWVNSATGSNGNKGKTREKPFATLDYAFGQCAANQGDVIFVAPNHAETITGAAGIAHDVAGVSVIGLGTGNQRGRFLMDGATTVTYAISAADAFVHNLAFASGNADVVACFDITGVYAHIDSCEFLDNVVDENFKSAISCSGADGTANGLKVTNNYFYTPDAATLGFILTTGDVTAAQISNNVVVSEGTGLATLVTCATGKDLKGVMVVGNYLSSKATANNLFIHNDTASPNNSGIIAHNRCGHADVTAGHVLGVVGGCRMFDNLSVSTDALSGFVIPAIDVDS